MSSTNNKTITLTNLWRWAFSLSITSLAIVTWYFVDTLAFVFKYSTYEQEAFLEIFQFGAVIGLLALVVSNILRRKFSLVPWLLLIASFVADIAPRIFNAFETGAFNLPLVRYFEAGAWNTTFEEAGLAIALMQFCISGVIYLLVAATVLGFVALRKMKK